MDQQQNNQNQSLQGLISPEQKDQFLAELGLESLPQDQKDQLMATMIDSVMGRIFNRISPGLTETDMQVIDQLMKGENADALVGQYLVSKVPNLNQIAAEEVSKFREEMKASVDVIKSSLPQ